MSKIVPPEESTDTGNTVIKRDILAIRDYMECINSNAEYDQLNRVRIKVSHSLGLPLLPNNDLQSPYENLPDLREYFQFPHEDTLEAVESSEFDLLEAHLSLEQETYRELDSPTNDVSTDELLDAIDAGRLVNKSDKTINRWYQDKRIIGIKSGSGQTDPIRYPAWQFSRGEILPGLTQLLEAIGNNTAPALRFITRPVPELGNQKPLSLLKSGNYQGLLEALSQNTNQDQLVTKS